MEGDGEQVAPACAKGRGGPVKRRPCQSETAQRVPSGPELASAPDSGTNSPYGIRFLEISERRGLAAGD